MVLACDIGHIISQIIAWFILTSMAKFQFVCISTSGQCKDLETKTYSKIGLDTFINSDAVLTVSPQILGSPGPLLITTPDGLYRITSSYVEFHGSLTTL